MWWSAKVTILRVVRRGIVVVAAGEVIGEGSVRQEQGAVDRGENANVVGPVSFVRIQSVHDLGTLTYPMIS